MVVDCIGEFCPVGRRKGEGFQVTALGVIHPEQQLASNSSVDIKTARNVGR